MGGIVEQADEQVSIVTVCRLIGMDEVSDEGRATKYLCPFAEFYHNNPTEKAFRVYPDTNSAFCFGGCGFFSPTMLYAKANDFVTKDDKLRLRDAANALMKAVGYLEPTVTSWDELVRPKPPPVNTEALKMAMQRVRDRLVREHEDRADHADVILLRLVQLLPSVKDAQAAEQWMEVGQQALRVAVGGQGAQSPSTGELDHAE